MQVSKWTKDADDRGGVLMTSRMSGCSGSARSLHRSHQFQYVRQSLIHDVTSLLLVLKSTQKTAIRPMAQIYNYLPRMMIIISTRAYHSAGDRWFSKGTEDKTVTKYRPGTFASLLYKEKYFTLLMATACNCMALAYSVLANIF